MSGDWKSRSLPAYYRAAVQVTTFPEGTPQFTIPFEPREITITNLDPTLTLQVSFDGKNIHGSFEPNTPKVGHTYHHVPRCEAGKGAGEVKVWFQAPSGAPVVELIAEE